jgi:hypothetical protein
VTGAWDTLPGKGKVASMQDIKTCGIVEVLFPSFLTSEVHD